ncbi:histidine-rich glycoprotein-like isoform X2 [Gorilla gorilla gorilla]|uniref:histidine-rich glycoprotein-like isoform X2 n=1 Tax=Gorilla gorilla gorilla TaxID=9595 RepID=UPI0030094938
MHQDCCTFSCQGPHAAVPSLKQTTALVWACGGHLGSGYPWESPGILSPQSWAQLSGRGGSVFTAQVGVWGGNHSLPQPSQGQAVHGVTWKVPMDPAPVADRVTCSITLHKRTYTCTHYTHAHLSTHTCTHHICTRVHILHIPHISHTAHTTHAPIYICTCSHTTHIHRHAYVHTQQYSTPPPHTHAYMHPQTTILHTPHTHACMCAHTTVLHTLQTHTRACMHTRQYFTSHTHHTHTCMHTCTQNTPPLHTPTHIHIHACVHTLQYSTLYTHTLHIPHMCTRLHMPHITRAHPSTHPPHVHT